MARTTPVVLDHGRLSITVPILSSDRSTGQAVLIALMALAFAAIVLAKLTSGNSAAANDGTPLPAVVGAPASLSPQSSEPAASAAPDPTAVPPASGGTDASAAPDPSAAPATRSYKVKSGDTLVGIAAKFGTTPKAISNLNGISDPSSLKIGQVLKIP
jgi:LysM repeat protein